MDFCKAATQHGGTQRFGSKLACGIARTKHTTKIVPRILATPSCMYTIRRRKAVSHFSINLIMFI